MNWTVSLRLASLMCGLTFLFGYSDLVAEMPMTTNGERYVNSELVQPNLPSGSAGNGLAGAIGQLDVVVQTDSSLVSSVAEDLTWHDNFDSGWKAAKQSGRPMVIFITSEACTYCDAMKRNTLCNESVRTKLARGFVSILLRPKHNTQVLSRIKVPAYPTTLVALPHGKVVAHRIGYQPPEEFHALLAEATVGDTVVGAEGAIASNGVSGSATTGMPTN